MRRRCRFSPEGLRWIRPRDPRRLGVCVSKDGGKYRSVIWDGTKSSVSYAARYIEFVDEPGATGIGEDNGRQVD